MNGLDNIARLLSKKGVVRYGAEAVSQLDHALQCATLAEQAGATDTLITAALLHDIGHLTNDDEGAAERGVDMRHEDRGADFLASYFGQDISEPVRLHVAAKRYLCATTPRYMDRLSPASVNSLRVQGGPYSTADAEIFSANPHCGAAVLLRVWDDTAKNPNAKTPSLSHYLERAENVAGGPGRLVLVVGPSGAGKDTLIAAAREHFAYDPRIIFPKRVVTRPCESEIEIHDTVSDTKFQRMAAAGKFCLHWQAHGLRYGIPNSAAHAISKGKTVVANVSRGVIEIAMARFRRVNIINVTADSAVLIARLKARGRTTDGDLACRLNRDIRLPKDKVIEIMNDGPIHASIAAFLKTIEATP